MSSPVFPLSRRDMLAHTGLGLGAFALAELLNPAGAGAADSKSAAETGGVLSATHHPPKAKRVIFLFQAGGPSQIDLFDHKPVLTERHGEELPESVRKGQRLTAMSGNQASLPLVGSPFKFTQHGEGGTWLSEALPQTAGIADDLCV
ncbi:MAG: DUF1501 domain-containing protein, partial [Planctomycetaceae bacterium]|nr:DUF1501 domain-containing protein [Planctomycetaceae bacterium]